MIDKELQPDFVKNVRKKAYLSQRDFGAKLGVSGSYIGQVETGQSALSKEVYDSIIKIFGDVAEPADSTIMLDYYPDTFGSCGSGVFEFSTQRTQLAVPKDSFFTHISSSKQYFVINAYGDSMRPLIYDKDKLIIERWNGEQIIDNRPYVFCYKDEIFVKKLVKNIDQLVILPENDLYDTRKLEGAELEEVDIIGQVVGIMRDLR